MIKTNFFLLVFIPFFACGGTGFAQQSDIFSYGTIPFGEGIGEIGSRIEENLDRADSPDAAFLAHDAVIRDANTGAADFFGPGISAPAKPGAAYVWLDEKYAAKYSVGTNGRYGIEIFFFTGPGGGAEGRLFLVRKRTRLNGRYHAVYDRIEESIRGRIGFNPESYDGTYYGGTLETYSMLAFWPQEDVTVLLQVRESRPQSETSVVDYIYIDTRLWREYRRAASGEGSRESGNLGDVMESF
ncbi:MAG: hypothetical protein ACLFRY_12550 [Spirochaetia bacterium]